MVDMPLNKEIKRTELDIIVKSSYSVNKQTNIGIIWIMKYLGEKHFSLKKSAKTQVINEFFK